MRLPYVPHLWRERSFRYWWISVGLLLAVVVLPSPSLSAEERMPYEQSAAIKRSMLPPGASMQDFELDHCRPLCLGGSNERSNLQLQPWPEARQKDVDEVAACKAVTRGEMTEEVAAAELARRWPCKQ